MKFWKIKILICLLGGLMMAGHASAQDCNTSQDYFKPGCADFELQSVLEESASDEDVDNKSELINIKKQAAGLNPMDITGPSDLFSSAINLMMAFIGSIALLLYIYGGFLWMSAGGNADRVNKAKTILVWTTLGAIAMGASYMIVRTVLEKVG